MPRRLATLLFVAVAAAWPGLASAARLTFGPDLRPPVGTLLDGFPEVAGPAATEPEHAGEFAVPPPTSGCSPCIPPPAPHRPRNPPGPSP